MTCDSCGVLYMAFKVESRVRDDSSDFATTHLSSVASSNLEARACISSDLIQKSGGIARGVHLQQLQRLRRQERRVMLACCAYHGTHAASSSRQRLQPHDASKRVVTHESIGALRAGMHKSC